MAVKALDLNERVYLAVSHGDTGDGDDGLGVTAAQAGHATGYRCPLVNLCLEQLAGQFLLRVEADDTLDEW